MERLAVWVEERPSRAAQRRRHAQPEAVVERRAPLTRSVPQYGRRGDTDGGGERLSKFFAGP